MKSIGFIRLAIAVCFMIAIGLGLFSGCVSLQPREVSLLQQSRFDELEAYMAGQIQDPALAPTSQLFYLCYAHSRVKRYDKLFSCLTHLQENIDAGDDKLYYFDFRAAPSLMRSEALMELGRLDEALAAARNAYQLTATPDTYLQMRIYAITAIGLVHGLRREGQAARKYAAELEAVRTSYPNTLMTTDKLTGLAKIYMSLKDYPNALAAIRKDRDTGGFKVFADVVSGAALSGESLFTYWELPKQYILNRCLMETGQTDAARRGYDQLLSMTQTQSNGDIYWMILFDRGHIAEQENQLGDALEYYRRAVDVFERQRSFIQTETSKIGFVGDKQQVYHRIVSLLLKKGDAKTAFEYAERAKSRALVDLLAEKKDFAIKTEDPESVQQLLLAIDQAENQERVQVGVSAAPSTRGVAVRHMEQLRRKTPELASLVSVSRISVSEIQSLLDPGETLLEYYAHEGALYAFVVDQTSIHALSLNFTALRDRIPLFRESLQDPALKDYQSLARAIYEQIFMPVQGWIKGSDVLIVPHGPLHYLPFDCLFDGQHYLLDRYAFHSLPSASVLKFIVTTEAPRQGPLLALGNPDLGDPRFNLKYAEEEAQAIYQIYPDSEVLIHQAATETAFWEHAPRYSFLHVACHGEFDADRPMQSALRLAADGKNDGLVTVGELFSRKIDAELVTLSACETGLGTLASGDELVGLNRGFLYAGARSIVASLWQVDDRATSLLMTHFYRYLGKMRKCDALRQAQISVREKYPHPYFWGAFQLTGNPY